MRSSVRMRGASRFSLLLSAWVFGGMLSAPAVLTTGCGVCCAMCMDYTRVTLELDAWWTGAWIEFEADGRARRCPLDDEERPRHTPCEPDGAIDVRWEEGRIEFQWYSRLDELILRVRDETTVHWEADVELDYERYRVCATWCVRAEIHLTVP